MFAALRQELVPLVAAIAAAPRRPRHEILERDFPVERQRIFGQAAAAAIGFDFDAGRLDVTTHPFCSGIGPGDCRLTTRYNAHHFNEAFFGILHEAGHGIYEQGLPREHFGTPWAAACSLGIHESQSRLWENQVGRSQPFWEHFFPRARQMFPDALGDVALDDFVFAINDVRPSFIRVEADEATYNMHIILRFELEQALIAGDLEPADVPGAWNEKFTKLLGITPPSDRAGLPARHPLEHAAASAISRPTRSAISTPPSSWSKHARTCPASTTTFAAAISAGSRAGSTTTSTTRAGAPGQASCASASRDGHWVIGRWSNTCRASIKPCTGFERATSSSF